MHLKFAVALIAGLIALSLSEDASEAPSNELDGTGETSTASGETAGSGAQEQVSSSDSSTAAASLPAGDGTGKVEESEVSTVEPNKTCIISNATHWSWLVKIVDKETGKQVCTGTLITDEDVLVPASCFMENTTQDVPESFYSLPSEILAIAGGGMDTDCMQVRNVSSIYPHKGYFENSEEHDYAFLKISPEFDVDDDDIPDIRYHLNVINSEGGLVNIHNNGPFCESPYFVDDGMNAKVSDEIHLLGMRIEDCMMIWNCSADFDTCLSYLHPASHACLKPLTPRKCGPRDKGAPLVCDEVLLGYLHQCDGELPMIFRGLNKAIKFLELEDDHVQRPGYLGRHY
uniref:Plasma kallikrein n=1 Tax=Lygus hesperus TaxID=30085 RepID=A0A0A9XLE1_LYGHE